MKRIKTKLRATMTDTRLNGLALLNSHRDIEVTIDEVFSRFLQVKRRFDL